ncbi:MAG TPA: iron chelate uptake ABC transporter family permease subunit, partial [Solirubrobacterales bacterium]|nr:iron chelate uptake ABC transporter family permease subunit [Solirubrobacterales bacterium]
MARRTLVFAALLVALVAAVVASLALGAVKVPFAEVIDIVFGKGGGGPEQQIVETLRLPRTVEAMVVGAALGIAGAILQGALANPLASPDVIGVTGG